MAENVITYQVNAIAKKALLGLCVRINVRVARMVMSVSLFVAVKMVAYVMKTRNCVNVLRVGWAWCVQTAVSRAFMD